MDKSKGSQANQDYAVITFTVTIASWWIQKFFPLLGMDQNEDLYFEYYVLLIIYSMYK